jgi:hypothetical protein
VLSSKADVVKLAYTTALGAVGRKAVGVQISPSAVKTVNGMLKTEDCNVAGGKRVEKDIGDRNPQGDGGC